MTQKISDYINLNQRLDDLDVKIESEFCILPENIASAKSKNDFVFTETALDIKKFLKLNNVEIELLPGNGLKLRQRKSIDFFLPIIFIGYSILTQNESLIATGLEILSKHIINQFKGTFGEKKVKLDIVIETKPKKEYKTINYEGSVEGLKEIPEIIKSLKNEKSLSRT
jgi:hypothetical protein